MNKKKLIELRCKAWGITEDEYYCNQCSDFSLEDMARAYRRGKNKGRADLEKQIAVLKEGVAVGSTFNKGLNSLNKALEEERDKYRNMVFGKDERLTKATKVIKDIVEVMVIAPIQYSERQKIDVLEKAEQFLKEE
jgi:hypothetical protein